MEGFGYITELLELFLQAQFGRSCFSDPCQLTTRASFPDEASSPVIKIINLVMVEKWDLDLSELYLKSKACLFSLPSQAMLLSGLLTSQIPELLSQISILAKVFQIQKHLFSQRTGLLIDTRGLCAPQCPSQLLSHANPGDPTALPIQNLQPMELDDD